MSNWNDLETKTITVENANLVSHRIHYLAERIYGYEYEIEGLVINDTTLNIDRLKDCAEEWGTDVDNLLTASPIDGIDDEEFINLEWDDKYQYAGLKLVYILEATIQQKYKGNPWQNMLLDIAKLPILNQRKRYDLSSVMQRADDVLAQLESSITGAIHKNGKKKDIFISTEYVFSFPDAVEMINSYCDMYLKYKELFIKIGNELKLSESERREFNYIASVLHMRDINSAPEPIYAGYAKELINYYIQKGFNSPEEVFNCCIEAQYSKNTTDDFCRCIEFINNKELVQRYLSICPREIAEMRNFIKVVKNFSVKFNQEPTYMTKEEFENLGIGDRQMIEDYYEYVGVEGTLGEDVLPVKDIPKPIELLVEKTDDELDCAKECINQIGAYLRPEKLGGLKRTYLPEQFRINNALDKFDLTRLYVDIKSRGLIYG